MWSRAPVQLFERQRLITLSKGGDLAYRSITMDLISCFRDIVGSKDSSENNGTLTSGMNILRKDGIFH